MNKLPQYWLQDFVEKQKRLKDEYDREIKDATIWVVFGIVCLIVIFASELAVRITGV